MKILICYIILDLGDEWSLAVFKIWQMLSQLNKLWEVLLVQMQIFPFVPKSLVLEVYTENWLVLSFCKYFVYHAL